jgi:hypothetical protein
MAPNVGLKPTRLRSLRLSHRGARLKPRGLGTFKVSVRGIEDAESATFRTDDRGPWLKRCAAEQVAGPDRGHILSFRGIASLQRPRQVSFDVRRSRKSGLLVCLSEQFWL